MIGNNDAEAWEGGWALKAVMARAGSKLLVNGGELARERRQAAHRRGGRAQARQPDARGLYPEVPARERYRVLLSHYPCMPDARPDLMLSGHTHGGQFNLLGLTPFSIGFERLQPQAGIRWPSAAMLHRAAQNGIDFPPPTRYNRDSSRRTYPGVCVSQCFYPQIQKRIPGRFADAKPPSQWKAASSRRSPPCLSGG